MTILETEGKVDVTIEDVQYHLYVLEKFAKDMMTLAIVVTTPQKKLRNDSSTKHCKQEQQLEFNHGKFPKTAMLAAGEQQASITPLLLNEIAESPEIIAQKDETYTRHIYAIYLLAQFREKAAYPLLAEFFSFPGDLSLEITGDIITEDLGRVLASVCHGDLSIIKKLIENFSIHECVRSAGLDALKTLVLQNKLDRNEVIEYLRTCFHNEEKNKNDSFFTTALVICACDLHPAELLPEIRRGFSKHKIDTFTIRLKDIEADAKKELYSVLADHKKRDQGLITDVIAEMHWWACFKSNAVGQDKKKEESQFLQQLSTPHVKTKKLVEMILASVIAVKYKKCCLQ